MSRVLDGGAQGVIVPDVNTSVQAEAIVSACRFPPTGKRSVMGLGPALGYRAVPLSEAEPKAQRRDVGHRIIIKKDAAASSVVWNPWAEKAAAMADLGDVGHFFYPVL